MKPEEIAAYVGAAAWLPQIGSWLYGKYITPRVTILPNRSVEIGFTTFGPIMNLSMAFSSDRRDAVVTAFDASIVHQDGDQHVLRWAGMSETFSEITDSTGKKQTVSKDQTPIAFKIGTDILLEKYVRFQEPKFSQEINKYINSLVTHSKFLKETEKDFVQKTLQSKEFRDLVKAHKESFWWKAGKYIVHFNMGSHKKLVLEDQSFYFILSQLDIDELRRNLDMIEHEFTNTIKSNLPEYKIEQLTWNWRYPTFDRDV